MDDRDEKQTPADYPDILFSTYPKPMEFGMDDIGVVIRISMEFNTDKKCPSSH